jgi:hypothetical protein
MNNAMSSRDNATSPEIVPCHTSRGDPSFIEYARVTLRRAECWFTWLYNEARAVFLKAAAFNGVALDPEFEVEPEPEGAGVAELFADGVVKPTNTILLSMVS